MNFATRILPIHKIFPQKFLKKFVQHLHSFYKHFLTPRPSRSTNFAWAKCGATSFHRGINRNGESANYALQLADESDGTRRLMSLAPDIEKVLRCGGVLLVDELEKEIHPMLVQYIVAKFQSSSSNPNHAQLIFTTHDTELLNMELLRKDEIYFVDKDRENGVSSLYSISDFGTATGENIRKGYLMGKYGAYARTRY